MRHACDVRHVSDFLWVGQNDTQREKLVEHFNLKGLGVCVCDSDSLSQFVCCQIDRVCVPITTPRRVKKVGSPLIMPGRP